jgi:hypothetical protein
VLPPRPAILLHQPTAATTHTPVRLHTSALSFSPSLPFTALDLSWSRSRLTTTSSSPGLSSPPSPSPGPRPSQLLRTLATYHDTTALKAHALIYTLQCPTEPSAVNQESRPPLRRTPVLPNFHLTRPPTSLPTFTSCRKPCQQILQQPASRTGKMENLCPRYTNGKTLTTHRGRRHRVLSNPHRQGRASLVPGMTTLLP